MLKSSVSKDMIASDSHVVLWNYCAEKCDSAHNMTSRNNFKLQSLTPYDSLTGEQSDISNLFHFGCFK